MRTLYLSILLASLMVSGVAMQQASATHEPGHSATTTSQFTLDVRSEPNNFLYIDGSGTYSKGASVTTGKAPDTWQGYKFMGWKVDGGQWYAGNPVTIRMEEDHTLTAVYSLTGSVVKSVTIDVVPRVTNVIVDGRLYLPNELPLSFEWGTNSQHSVAIEESEVNDVADKRYSFHRWTDLNTDMERSFTVTSDLNLKAIFKEQYYLRIISDTGEVKGSGWYNKGEKAVFSVSPKNVPDEEQEGHRLAFISWDIGDAPKEATNSITVDRPIIVRADWKDQYYLDVTSSLEGVSVAGSGWYEKGQKVTLLSDKDVDSGIPGTKYVLDEWVSKGAYPVIINDPGAASGFATLTMENPHKIEAQWKKAYYIEVSSAYGLATGTGYYAEGSFATISVPTSEVLLQPGKVRVVFDGWSGAGTGSSITQQNNVQNNAPASGTALSASVQSPLGQGSSPVISAGSVTPSTQIKVTHPATIVAKWKPQYYLDVSSTLGSASGSGWYDAGSAAPVGVDGQSKQVNLWMKNSFDRWTGDYKSDVASSSVTMDGPKKIKAEWREDYSPALVNGGILGGVGIAGLMAFNKYKKSRNGKAGQLTKNDISSLR